MVASTGRSMSWSTPMCNLRARYLTGVSIQDPVRREVARRQLARLDRPRASRDATPASVWAHVPLAELFREAGNVPHVRARGRIEIGHVPFHASRSGRCVTIDGGLGLWWCRGCRRGGDPLTFVMQWKGWRYPAAATWLATRYGPPPARGGSRVLRPPVEA